MLLDGTCILCMIYHICHGLDLYYADPAQALPGEELGDLDHDLSDLSVRCVV